MSTVGATAWCRFLETAYRFIWTTRRRASACSTVACGQYNAHKMVSELYTLLQFKRSFAFELEVASFSNLVYFGLRKLEKLREHWNLLIHLEKYHALFPRSSILLYIVRKRDLWSTGNVRVLGLRRRWEECSLFLGVSASVSETKRTAWAPFEHSAERCLWFKNAHFLSNWVKQYKCIQRQVLINIFVNFKTSFWIKYWSPSSRPI